LELLLEEPMHAAGNPKLYAEAVHARVSSEDFAAIKQRAAEAKVSTGEWLRGVIAKELRGDQNTRVLLAELLHLQTILLTLQTEGWRDVAFTDAQLREMVAKAGARKFAAADRVLMEAKQG
jgi:hypothetical protein